MGSVPAHGEADDAFDLSNCAAVLSAAQAMREIITAEVVHKDSAQARALVAEYVEVHGRYLVYAAATFVDYHTTDDATPDLAADRFHYLLTRIGNLVKVLADHAGRDEVLVLLDILSMLNEAFGDDDPDLMALRAAQTCLVAHALVRRGRAPWGIQQSLDRNDMLAANHELGFVLTMVACAGVPDSWIDVVGVLLQEARHILSSQAMAANVTIENLVEDYFLALAANDVS